jgi:5-oxoprolinase (ATP-hydrolysing)
MSSKKWKIWVDTGGTFTDCLAIDPQGRRRRVKVLSSSALRGRVDEQVGPASYRIEQSWAAPDKFIAGFRFQLLDESCGEVVVQGFDAESSVLTLERPVPFDIEAGAAFEVVSDEEAPVLAARLVTATSAGQPLPPLDLRLATTKGTNALLERTGAPTALFVTEGHADLLAIGTQERPELFALEVQKPTPLYDRVVEVKGRLSAEGSVHSSLDLESLSDQLDGLLAAGIRSVAVALMHSYRNPDHEERLAERLYARGFEHVSLSSELSPFIKVIPRAETALVNAYLQPVIEAYIAGVRARMSQGRLDVMTSAGGLVDATSFRPKDSLLSGPAGGVVGAASSGEAEGIEKVISFDMGGTSTDVARYDGDYDYVFEHDVGDAHLVAPALSIETVAAGGGSVCTYDGHALGVGPQSAGAFPGPACYGAGGPLTVTDVNLLLGRLDPSNFTIPVALEEAQRALQGIVDAVNHQSAEAVSEQAVLEGFLEIANERMADAIRKVSLRKGYDPKEYALVSYGGAGGQHACAIARRLGIGRILIPADAGVLSAYGLGHALREQFAEEQVLLPLDAVEDRLPERICRVEGAATEKLLEEGVSEDQVEIRRRLVHMRLEGQEATLEVSYANDKPLRAQFKKAYERYYGHWIPGRDVEVESIRVVASTKATWDAGKAVKDTGKAVLDAGRGEPVEDRAALPVGHKPGFFNGREVQTPIYRRDDIAVGACIKGPALILDPHSTIVIEPGWEGSVRTNGTLRLESMGPITSPAMNGHAKNSTAKNSTAEGDAKRGRPEAVKLELYTNRFSAIAEEMGEMFQRTALSVNVKERLDFSCGLLSAEGELVVNAPHIPVHLGALGLCVRRVMEAIEMKPGDVVVTNHPAYGGAHLPDVTVVTPVYAREEEPSNEQESTKEELIGYVASRAHHAEIGGTRPGSMPPAATRLVEEGVVIPPMYLVRRGKPQWDAIRNHLLEATYSTRNVEENIADLQAAVAANHRGAHGLRALVQEHGIEQVRHYMQALKQHAADKMRETIRALPEGRHESVERLDDGSVIKATVTVGPSQIDIDFAGTAGVHPGNLNATPAIVNSVVMYVLRLLIDEPLPLNEGLLDPVTLHLPVSFLNPPFTQEPSECPAVVGGNIETSQRLVDTLLKPFDRAACSQGTMNNVLFGSDRFGYYETVCGGTGAGPGFDGADAVHHHMTNTRGTDPEILERRYPVRLERYAIRPGSGGKGRHTGGNGIVREMTFLAPVSLSVLTQHRVERPYGLCGGEMGQPGAQWVIHRDGRKEKLQSVDGRDVEAGDRFVLHTPGGGGYGNPQ